MRNQDMPIPVILLEQGRCLVAVFDGVERRLVGRAPASARQPKLLTVTNRKLDVVRRCKQAVRSGNGSPGKRQTLARRRSQFIDRFLLGQIVRGRAFLLFVAVLQDKADVT